MYKVIKICKISRKDSSQLHMDNIWVFAKKKNEIKLEALIQAIEILDQYIGMEFCTENCSILKGKK